MKKPSKTEARKEISEFFSGVKNKSSKEVNKIKRLAMQNNIPLKNFRKKFCKKCFSPYVNPKVRVRKGMKIIECEGCGNVSRWRINSS